MRTAVENGGREGWEVQNVVESLALLEERGQSVIRERFYCLPWESLSEAEGCPQTVTGISGKNCVLKEEML